MARKPSDDIRDAKRALKVKGQQFDWLNYNKDGFSKGWSTDPTVKKSEYKNKLNPDGFRIDWDEKHHLQGLNLYDLYTQGMTPEQIKVTDERLANEGMYKGNNGLNRIDLPRRHHHSSKYAEYEGAHQQTMREGIDSKGELKRLEALSPDARFAELESFVSNQARHRKVGQQKFMEQFQLEPGNDSSANVFGGNFSQAVLQDRDKSATAKAGAALREERRLLSDINQQGGSTSLNINAIMTKSNMPALGGFIHHNKGPSVTADQSTYTPPKLQPSQTYTPPKTPVTPNVNRAPSLLENVGAAVNQAMPVLSTGLAIGAGIIKLGFGSLLPGGI